MLFPPITWVDAENRKGGVITYSSIGKVVIIMNNIIS